MLDLFKLFYTDFSYGLFVVAALGFGDTFMLFALLFSILLTKLFYFWSESTDMTHVMSVLIPSSSKIEVWSRCFAEVIP